MRWDPSEVSGCNGKSFLGKSKKVLEEPLSALLLPNGGRGKEDLSLQHQGTAVVTLQQSWGSQRLEYKT